MLFWWRARKQTSEGKHSKTPIWDTRSKGIQQRIRLDSAKPAEGNRAAKCAFVVIPAAGALIAITKRWRKKWVRPLWKWNKVRGSSERTQQPNLGASGPGRLPTPLEQRRAWTARGEAPPAQFSKKTADRRGQQVDVSTPNWIFASWAETFNLDSQFERALFSWLYSVGHRLERSRSLWRPSRQIKWLNTLEQF